VATCFVLTCATSGFATPQEEGAPQAEEAATSTTPSFTFNGLVFGDIYGVPSHHLPEADGSAGAWIRRIYLTADTEINDYLFGRFRVEINQSGEFESYSFHGDFKDVYLGVEIREQRVLFGLSFTPTFDLVEQTWGLRYLEKTPLDLQKVASRHTGISAQGPLNQSGTLRYRAMIGAGINFGNESGDGSKFMLALTWLPTPAWTVDLYGDYEFLEGPTDRSTWQGFVAYKVDSGRFGFLYSNQDRQEDPPLELASFFGVRKLTDRVSLVGRVDRLIKPSPSGNDIDYLPFDPTAPATLFIAGVEVNAYRGLLVTPNAEIIAYDRNDAGERPETDVVLRLTMFLQHDIFRY